MSAFGECIVTRVQVGNLTGPDELRIDRADPVVLISPELLDEVRQNPPDSPATFDGRVLRIRGVNRTVVYRIRDVLEPVPGMPGHWNYVGEWPD